MSSSRRWLPMIVCVVIAAAAWLLLALDDRAPDRELNGRRAEGVGDHPERPGPTLRADDGRPPISGSTVDVIGRLDPATGATSDSAPLDESVGVGSRILLGGPGRGEDPSAVRSDWSRKFIPTYPNAVVELPGRFATDSRLFVELVETSGTPSTPVECPLIVFGSSAVALIPTGSPGRERVLRFTLMDGDVARQVVDVPLRNQGLSFSALEAQQVVDRFIGRGPDSVLSREIMRLHESGRRASEALPALERFEKLLRQQFAIEDASTAADRHARTQAIRLVEERSESARQRIAKLQP